MLEDLYLSKRKYLYSMTNKVGLLPDMFSICISIGNINLKNKHVGSNTRRESEKSTQVTEHASKRIHSGFESP